MNFKRQQTKKRGVLRRDLEEETGSYVSFSGIGNAIGGRKTEVICERRQWKLQPLGEEWQE